jgi:TRAP-type C4-dicarboxylate transport system substrate-binding protein
VNEVSDPKAFQAAMAPVYEGFITANPDLEALIKDIQATK